MSYEKIDDTSRKDKFDELISSVINLSKETSPDIKTRVELEKKLKLYLKIKQSDLVLNFILECINKVDEYKAEKKDSK